MRSGRLRKAGRTDEGQSAERKPNQTHDVPAKIRSWPDKGHTKKDPIEENTHLFCLPCWCDRKNCQENTQRYQYQLSHRLSQNGGDGEMGDGELSRVWLEFDYEKKEEKGGVLKAWPARGRAFGVQLEKER